MADALLSYDEAIQKILAALPNAPLGMETVSLAQARGRVLAQTIVAGENVPPFDNSAVDGFAVRLPDTEAATPENPAVLAVTQTIAAEPSLSAAPAVQLGQAARIFTGAPLPPGANAVVMVEDTETHNETVSFLAPASAGFIRKAGSDIALGQTALEAGTVLDAGATGLLAALGISDVPCRLRPRVGLVTTGDEVTQNPNAPLLPGQIRDANGPALRAAIEEAGATVVVSVHARDTPEAVAEAFSACEEAQCEVIIASGGVSVGDRDFVKSVVETRGHLQFWRVAVRPGKPLAFGGVGGALFWGLPGNPVSSLVTFELFVRPALRKMGGFETWTRRTAPTYLLQPLKHEPGRREFIRARVVWNAPNNRYEATPTGAQGSHRLMSLVRANALLAAHETRGDYQAGETLDALLWE